MIKPSRRLWGVFVVFLFTSVTPYLCAATHSTIERARPGNGCPAETEGGTVLEPAVRSSKNGVLNVSLSARSSKDALGHARYCYVDEFGNESPTLRVAPGDTLKIGRRGSINFVVRVRGVQGHVGYPQTAKNPIPALAALVTRFSSHRLDDGNAHFEPSTLSFTSVDVGNRATNVIPAEAHAAFNIRFNDEHTLESLLGWARLATERVARETGCEIILTSSVSGVAFVTKPGPFTELVSRSVKRATNAAPEMSTSGGTSDARFIKDYCPALELGLAGSTMHKVDECVPVADIHRLTDIYFAILTDYFAKPPA